MDNQITDVNSYAVYSRIYPNRLNFITWTFFGGLGFMLCFLWVIDRHTIWELYIGLGLIASVICAVTFNAIMKRLTYKNYKTFRDEAGFRVNGWENLLRNPDILKPQHWALKSSVEVIVKPGATEANRKIIADALYLFTTAANQRYYKSYYGNGRVEWKDESWTKVTGSVDVAVAGDIYTLIQKYLTAIQRSTGCIEAVHVNLDEKLSYVKFSKGAR